MTASIGAGAYVGVRHQDDHWTPLYDRAVTQVSRWKSEAADWQSDSERWRQSNQQYRNRLHDLKTKVEAQVGDLDNPRFTLWNSCGPGGPAAGCRLTPGHYYVGGIPDTFTYFVSFRSTVPVTLMIMDAHNFACWDTRACSARWVEWKDRTTLTDAVFHDAEGCAGYFAVFISDRAGTLYPDVSIVRHPAAHLTGSCR